MQVLLISTDLMVSSMLQGAADAAGVGLDTAPPNSAASRAGAGTLLAIIDLSAPALDVASTVSALRAAAPQAKLIAFGPHVHTGRLQQARDAGCDRVMSRGEMHAKAHEVLTEVVG